MKLRDILLAGTLVPALALAPIGAAFAQEGPGGPGERHAPGGPGAGAPHAAPGGAPHAEGPRAGAPGGAEHRAPPAAAEHRAPPAQREAPAAAERHAAPAQREAPAAAERHAAPAQREAPAAAERHAAPAQREAPAAAERHTAPARHEAPAAAERHAPPAERAAPAAQGNAPARDNAAHETPAERRATQGGANPAARTGAAPGEHNRAQTPAAGRNEPASPNGAPQDARHRGPEGRDNAAGQPAANAPAPGTAPGAQQGRRGVDPASPEGGGFRNGDNSRGNAYVNGNRDNGGRDSGGRDNGGRDNRRGGGIGPGGAAAIGAAAGFAGGFLAATGAQNLEGIRRDRREVVEDGRTYIREPGRTIVEDGDRAYIVHDENDRFRELGYRVDRQRRGNDYVDVVNRPDGTQILTYTDPDGRMLRRVRRTRDGREFVLIDNGYDGRVRPIQDDVVVLPPPPIDIPRDRYDVDYQDVDEGVIYDTFTAPPLQAPPQRYTLDQIRYSPDVRRYVRSVDINTINFDSGSWIVPASATGKLQALATAIKRTIDKNPNSVFLVEGFTDATGNPTDNLSLSDRRAQSVAAILTKSFNVPPENLTTQGYGQQNLKVNTQGPSAANRRVVVQNITPLLAAGGQPPR